MYESFIKDWLLNGQSRVYSVIVTSYRQKLDDLKPSLFRKWLAKELDVPEDKINLSSLNSALVRQRKKESKGKNKPLITGIDNATHKEQAFVFSSADETLPKKRATEL